MCDICMIKGIHLSYLAPFSPFTLYPLAVRQFLGEVSSHNYHVWNLNINLGVCASVHVKVVDADIAIKSWKKSRDF